GQCWVQASSELHAPATEAEIGASSCPWALSARMLVSIPQPTRPTRTAATRAIVAITRNTLGAGSIHGMTPATRSSAAISPAAAAARRRRSIGTADSCEAMTGSVVARAYRPLRGPDRPVLGGCGGRRRRRDRRPPLRHDHVHGRAVAAARGADVVADPAQQGRGGRAQLSGA